MTTAIIQARIDSTRLAGKVLEEIENKPMIWHVLKRLSFSKKIDNIVLAIPDTKENDILEKFAKENNIDFFRGSEQDILSRYYSAAQKFNSDIIVRITSDCPLIDPQIVDLIIEKHLNSKADYSSNIFKRTFPRGFDAEVFSFQVLEKAYNQAKQDYQREHVTPYIWENQEIFKIQNIQAPKELNYPEFRLAVDTKEDLQLIREIYKELYKPGKIFYAKEIIGLFLKKPELIRINLNVKQKPVIKEKDADAIVFLQGDKLDRAPKTLSLYRQGLANKIVITGNNTRAEEINDSSLSEIKEYFLSNGVPEENIIIDSKALNSLEQAINVVNLAQNKRWKKLIIVTSPYHILRAYLNFSKQMKEQNWNGEIIIQEAELPLDEDKFKSELEKIKKYKLL